jgi:hypothetical protein
MKIRRRQFPHLAAGSADTASVEHIPQWPAARGHLYGPAFQTGQRRLPDWLVARRNECGRVMLDGGLSDMRRREEMRAAAARIFVACDSLGDR